MLLHVYINGALGEVTIQSHNLPVDDLNIGTYATRFHIGILQYHEFH